MDADTSDAERFNLIEFAIAALPMVGTIVVSVLVIVLVDRWMAKRPRSLSRPATMAGLTVVALIFVVLSAPIDDATQGQLLSLFGIALTAAIALASTTFVSNAMAGLMLRSLRNFSAGDFIRVDGHFGRVTERGLFHTEIQTEDRDLTTIPNLLLATKPTSVVRASGTIISARVSLGYDTSRGEIESALKAGAEAAGLEEPFVQVVELGDYSVTYRVAGFLPEVKHLVSARSRLRAKAMDALHSSGIEIVSPTFMNQRRVDDMTIVPPAAREDREPEPDEAPERVMFDKADAAERIEALEKERDGVKEKIVEQEKALKSAGDDEKERTEGELADLKSECDRLECELEEARKDEGGEGNGSAG